jgi:methyl-accepting chemotaxis protein
MNYFTQLGIAKRLHLVSFTLIIALVLVALTAWMQLSDVSHITAQTGNSRVPQLQRISDIELNVTRESLQIRHAMLVYSDEDLKKTITDIKNIRALLKESFKLYEQGNVTAEGIEAFKVFPPLVEKFWKLSEENIKLIDSGQKDAAFMMLITQTTPARNQLLDALANEKQRQGLALSTDINQIEDKLYSIIYKLIGLVVVIFIGLIILSVYITIVLRKRVAVAQKVAERVRDGDLSFAIHDNSNDEFSPLLSTMHDMQHSLTNIVSLVRQNSDSVASASVEIANGNYDLSSRTEQQSITLEQTNQSMSNLSATVKQNTQNALQANQLAKGANEVAVKGGNVVNQVVETMKDIHDSSKKIADIISVIDGIAFQTNILALNAAVEAARAGEHGRGFAVVATEVRGLAQRSANAAKEIKELISESVERVAVGSDLVNQAGTTMQEVVNAITRVTDIMNEISHASVEQRTGVEQVDQAIKQMDDATQQNSALVEQSSAAAESLREQAQQLVEAVASFKLIRRIN